MLDGLPVFTYTPGALLGVAILLVFTGRLLPRFTYTQKSLEADKWREAFEKEREARAASDAQTAELLQVSQTNHKIISAMFESIRHLERAGVTDVAQEP
jgi:hypothetical protein